MATDVSSMPVNGNYAPHQGFGGIEQPQSGYAYSANSSQATITQATMNHMNQATIGQQPPPTSSTPAAAASGQGADVPKDEVGWYFVEQYYTTLSRNPERLYLFYNKKSQFVSGQETDKVAVCVGQKAINDRIKELDFHECKVRVTNVDSQASDTNIVIQVIGEISNKSQPHRKFTQTFVLAAQINGYFVLNDIFRYLIDEEDEPEGEVEPPTEEVQQAVPAAESGYQEPAPSAAEVEPKTLTSSMDPVAVEHDAQQVDKELEDKALKKHSEAEASEPTVNGTGATESEVQHAEDAPAAAVAQPEEPTTTDATQPAAKEEGLKTEKPKEPEPTPSASPPKQATPQPAPPPKPAAPKTWASLVGSGPRVATPVTSSTAAPTTTQHRPAPPTSKPALVATSTSAAPATQTTPTASSAERAESPAAGSSDEWTAVGHNRQQSRQEPQNRGYIKNVHENIDGNELKVQLEQYGELIYFDISRQKNCAFVDFKNAEGYNAAVNANPHNVSGERLYVEERRVRPGSTPYVPRGQFQGGRGRGGVNQGTPRGNYQGRGGYAPRGARGGAPAPRGRGSPQAS